MRVKDLLKIRRDLVSSKKIISDFFERGEGYVNIGDFFIPVKVLEGKILYHVGSGVFLEIDKEKGLEMIENKIKLIERRIINARRIKKGGKPVR